MVENGSDEADVGGLGRPMTMYLADHTPHLVVAAPMARGNDGSGDDEGTRGNDGAGVEVRAQRATVSGGERLGGYGGFYAQSPYGREARGGREENEGGKEETGVRTKEKFGERNRNWLIGVVFVLALVVAIVIFAVLVYLAHKPGGVAG